MARRRAHDRPRGLGAAAAGVGRYTLVLTATAGTQSFDDRSLLVLTRPR